MHYKNGEPAAVGHVVKGPHFGTPKGEVIGHVVGGIPGSDACNLYVAPLAFLYGDGEVKTVVQAAPCMHPHIMQAKDCDRVA